VDFLPADTQARAVEDDDRAQQEDQRRDRDLGALAAKRGPDLVALGHSFLPSGPLPVTGRP